MSTDFNYLQLLYKEIKELLVQRVPETNLVEDTRSEAKIFNFPKKLLYTIYRLLEYQVLTVVKKSTTF